LKLVKGATECMEILHKRNIKKTIATASEITNLFFINKQFGLDQWFDFEKIV